MHIASSSNLASSNLIFFIVRGKMKAKIFRIAFSVQRGRNWIIIFLFRGIPNHFWKLKLQCINFITLWLKKVINCDEISTLNSAYPLKKYQIFQFIKARSSSHHTLKATPLIIKSLNSRNELKKINQLKKFLTPWVLNFLHIYFLLYYFVAYCTLHE